MKNLLGQHKKAHLNKEDGSYSNGILLFDSKLMQKNYSEVTQFSRESLEIKGKYISNPNSKQRMNSAETINLNARPRDDNKVSSGQPFHGSQEDGLDFEIKPEDLSQRQSDLFDGAADYNQDYQQTVRDVGWGYKTDVKSKLNKLMITNEKKIHQMPYFLKKSNCMTRLYSGNINSRIIKNLVKSEKKLMRPSEMARSLQSAGRLQDPQPTISNTARVLDKKFLISKQELDKRLLSLHKKILIEDMGNLEKMNLYAREEDIKVSDGADEEVLSRQAGIDHDFGYEPPRINHKNHHVHLHLKQLERPHSHQKPLVMRSAENLPRTIKTAETKVKNQAQIETVEPKNKEARGSKVGRRVEGIDNSDSEDAVEDKVLEMEEEKQGIIKSQESSPNKKQESSEKKSILKVSQSQQSLANQSQRTSQSLGLSPVSKGSISRVGSIIKATLKAFSPKKSLLPDSRSFGTQSKIVSILRAKNQLIMAPRRSSPLLKAKKANDSKNKRSKKKDKVIMKMLNAYNDQEDESSQESESVEYYDMQIKQENLAGAETNEKFIVMEQEFIDEIQDGCEKLRKKFQNFVDEERIAKENLKPKDIREADEFLRVNRYILTNEEITTLKYEFEQLEYIHDYDLLDDILHRLKFFLRFKKPTRILLLKSSKFIKVERGTILFRQGDYGDMMYVIVKGGVNVIQKIRINDRQYEERVIACLYDGSNFGELSMMETSFRTKGSAMKTALEVRSLKDIKNKVEEEEFRFDLMRKREEIKRILDDTLRLKAEGIISEKEDDMIEKLKNDYNEALKKEIRENTRRLATIEVAETTYMLEIPREHFRDILMSFIHRDLESKLAVLNKISFLESFEPLSLIPLANCVLINSYKLGEIVLNEGDILKGLYIVASGKARILKKVLVQRPVEKKVFTKRMSKSLRNFHFGPRDFMQVEFQSPPIPKDETKSKNIKRNYGKKQSIKDSEEIRLKSGHVKQRLEEFKRIKDNDESSISYWNFINYKTLICGDVFGERSLSSEDIKETDDPSEKQIFHSKVSVISDSSKLEIFLLEPNHLHFLPEYLKGYIVRSLTMLKPFDDYKVEADSKNRQDWINFKNDFMAYEFNRIKNSKDGMIYYKAF